MALAHKTPLTATEIGILWNQYMLDTMSICIENFHAAKEVDNQAQALFKEAVVILKNTTAQIELIFNKEDIPLPEGFTDQDVNLAAPALYSGIYRLYYIKFKLDLRLMANGYAVALSSREDVRKLYRSLANDIMNLESKVTNFLLDKGLYIRPPYITVGEIAEYVHERSFLGSYFGGNQRKLLAMEINALFSNIQNNIIGQTLLKGFGQVSMSQQIRQYMHRGVEIANKNVQILSSLLHEDGVPVPSPWDSGVTNSAIPPYSDKLMLFHVSLLNQVGITAYSTALSAVRRKDLYTTFLRLIAETGQYALAIIDLSIDKNYMEEPPQFVNHMDLGLH